MMRRHFIVLAAAALWSSVTARAAPLDPYTAFAWESPWLSGTPRISPLVWASGQSEAGMTARKLAAIAPGRRTLFIWHAHEQIWGDPADSVRASAADVSPANAQAPPTYQGPWLDHGAAARAAWFGPWLDEVKKSHASVDFLVTDAEVGLSMWQIQPPQVRAIAADPRFAPLAQKYAIHEIAAVGNIWRWDVCSAWNEAMIEPTAQAFRTAYFLPLTSRFPDAGYSEYFDVVLPSALAGRARDPNGWAQPCPEPLFGTHQSPALYGQMRQLADAGRNDGTNPDFRKDPLATIAWQAGCMRAFVLGSSHPILPWFCAKSWRGDAAGFTPLAATPYWEELICHCMLSGGCVNCLFWDPSAPPSDLAAMNQVLTDLKSQTGNSPALKPLISDVIPFNATTILSGAECSDGRRIYRVSVLAGVTSATVRLPNEPASRTVPVPVGQVGAWIVVPR